MKKNNVNVSDLFKNPGEFRAKAELGADYFYNNRSVYSKNFTPRRYSNAVDNEFSRIVKADNVKDIRLIDDGNGDVYSFQKGSNNTIEYFYYKTLKIDYKEITKVEATDGEGQMTLKMMGFNNFYKLYKKNEYGLEQHLCNLATRVVE